MWFKAKREKRELEERLEKVERAIAGLRLDWEETYDKMVKLVQRYTKRAEVIAQSEEQAQPANGSLTGSTTATKQLDPMSKRILERRSRIVQGAFEVKDKTQ
jgi:phage shock protein A